MCPAEAAVAFFLSTDQLFPSPPPPFDRDLNMAERMAARLAAQEKEIELLSVEIKRLRDGICGGQDILKAVASSSPELEDLRTENEKLKYRLIHLRRGLQEELAQEAKQGPTQPQKDQERREKPVKEKQTNNIQKNNTQQKVVTVF